MATPISKVRIFFSSTNEIQEEKKWLDEVVSNINRLLGNTNNFLVEVFDYKTIGSQIGNTDGQSHINNSIKDAYDIYFGVLGQRFGSQTVTGETGTESEFNIALESYRATNKPLLSFFFKNIPYSGSNLDQVKQWAAVLEFKKRISGQGLYIEYSNELEYKKACEETLSRFLDLIIKNNKILKAEQTSDYLETVHYLNLKHKFNSYTGVREEEQEFKFNDKLIAEAGIEVVKNLEHSGFVTYYAKANEFWNSDTTRGYLNIIRSKAKEGKHVTRVYILENSDLLDNEDFRNLLKEDLNAKIQTKLILESDIGDKAKDFGLWDCFDNKGEFRIDGGIVCFVELGGHGKAIACSFTSKVKNIEEGIKYKDAIMNNERLKDASYVIESIDQQKINKIVPNSITHEAITMMELFANKYCGESYLPEAGPEENCKWYHKAWQYLRLLGMVSTPEWHNNFFITELTNAIKDKINVNILISGLADFGILAYVMKVCDKHGKYSVIHIIDSCKTPLLISDWYQSKIFHTSKIRTFQCDAKHTDLRDAHYDIIVTDAFLSRFENLDRKKVLAEWGRMLKIGGVVITTLRKRAQGSEISKATEEEKVNFAKLAKQKIKEWKLTHTYPIQLELNETRIESLALDYAEHMTSHKTGEITDIKNAFQASNLEIFTCNEVETQGEYSPTTYLQIVAQKI